MRLVYRIHDDLAVGYYENDPCRWAITLCRDGFQVSTRQRVNEGEAHVVDAVFEKFLHQESYGRSAQVLTYRVQDKTVVGWLACDTGKETFPVSRRAFEEIALPIMQTYHKPAFEQGDVATIVTRLTIL